MLPIVAKPTHFSRRCLFCPARAQGECVPLSEDEAELVHGFRSEDREIPAGQTIFSQGALCDEFFTVLDGWVFLYQVLESGSRQVLDFALPGEFVGFQSVLSAPMLLSAEALTDAHVCVLPRVRFLRFFQDHPEVGVRLTWLAARCEARAQDHLINVSRRPALSRVAHLLLELFYRDHQGLPRRPGESMHFPLTQEHIGDALGLTSVHVNRMLRKLREQDIVSVRDRRLEVLNPARLIETAEFDESAFFGA